MSQTISNDQEYEEIEQSQIDLFKLKIFALLMCRGKSDEKADVLVDIILGHHLGEKKDTDVISWMNPRLVTSIKNLIYFSEIFPKKYLKNYLPTLP